MTPAFNALAARGRLFRQAYATVPETLPSHISMLTGLYPAGHGVHENARFLGADQALLAESLGRAGYRTAAFVSSFVLSRRFGLSRGFEHYDDELPGAANERDAASTTERALAYLAQQDSSRPLFLWVHYFDPHAPYEPPARFRAGYAHTLPGRGGRRRRATRAPDAGLRSAAPGGGDRLLPAIMARGSATTANRSTATCSISRRCTCRW